MCIFELTHHDDDKITPTLPPHSVSEHEFMTHMEVENHDDYYTFETDGRIIVSDSTGTNIIYDAAMVDLRSARNTLHSYTEQTAHFISQYELTPSYLLKLTKRLSFGLDLTLCDV